MTGNRYDTPIAKLLHDSGMLSVNQLIFYTAIMKTFKVKKSQNPTYLYERLKALGENGEYRTHRNQQNIQIKFKLTTARQGFMYRVGRDWSSLPSDLKKAFEFLFFHTFLQIRDKATNIYLK